MIKSVEDLGDIEVGVKVLEAVLGVSEQYIGRLVKDGVLIKSGRGSYPLVTCVRAYVDNLRDKQKTVTTLEDGSQKINAANELALLRQKQGTLVDIRIHTEAGKMVRTDEAMRIFGGVLSDAKSHFSSLPTRLATKLEGLDKREIFVELSDFVQDTLRRLSAPAKFVDAELLGHLIQVEQSTRAEIATMEQADDTE